MGARKRIVCATAVSAALLVPLAVFGGSSFAHGFAAAWQYGHGSGGSQYQYGKVTICHHTHSEHHPFVTITVGARAAAFFVQRGDTVGACPGTTPPPARHHDDDGNGSDEQSEHQGDHHGGDNHGDHGSVVISTTTAPTFGGGDGGGGDQGGNGHGDSHGGGEHGGHGH